jgi:capsular polysaccharide biosynthesis protein
MDTRSSVTFLLHRWPILLASGLIGAVLSVPYAVLVPMELTSTSLVLLQQPAQSQSDGTSDIDTQVRLAQSRPVLQRAGRAVRPALSASEVAKKVTVDAATSQLIEIHASSPRAAEAQALSQGVAEAYAGALTENARSVTGTTIGDMRSRETLLRQQVKALQDQIDATDRRKRGEDPRSPEARRDAQLLAQLQVDQAEASLKWNQVKEDLAKGAAVGLANPALIVQPAAPATGPGLLSYRLTSALAGAALAAVLAAVVLLLRERRDPRLRTRDDLADAVASTVLADVRSRPQRSVAEWLALFQTYEAPAVDAWAFRQVLHVLAATPDPRGAGRTAARRLPGRVEHPRSVTVVSLAGDRRGLAVGPQLASFAASLGLVTHFVAAAGHGSADSLWAACSSDRAPYLRTGLVVEAHTEDPEPGEDERSVAPPAETFDELLEGLLLSDSREGEGNQEIDPDAGDDSENPEERDDDVDKVEGVVHSDGERGQGAEGTPVPDPESSAEAVLPATVRVVPKHALTDLTVVLAVADRREPTLSGLPATAVTVLAISPGFGNREELARLAVAVDDSGRRIDGIIIADPDPADATTGRRTLDERALETPLPVRTTGVSQLPLAGGDRGKSR